PNTQEPTPTNTPEAPQNNVEQAAAQEREAYMAMSNEEFAALQDNEHADFVNLTNAMYMAEFVKAYESNPRAEKGTYLPASPNMTPQQASDLVTWQLRLAFSLTGDEREKYILAQLRGGASSQAYSVYEDSLAN